MLQLHDQVGEGEVAQLDVTPARKAGPHLAVNLHRHGTFVRPGHLGIEGHFAWLRPSA